jgi:hypothetical protein
MRVGVELEGLLYDVQGSSYEAFRRAVGRVQWSAVDAATFWRLWRTKGERAVLLPGARPVKSARFLELFAEELEGDETIGAYLSRPGQGDLTRALERFGPVTILTSGTEVAARGRLMAKGGPRRKSESLTAVCGDLAARTAVLARWSGGRPALVIASGGSLTRAACEAGIFVVGVANGSCIGQRLHQAGADLVYPDTEQLLNALRGGGEQLVRAGLRWVEE